MSSTITTNIISVNTANIYNNIDTVISIKYELVIDDLSEIKECFLVDMPKEFKSFSNINKQDLKNFIYSFSEDINISSKLIKDLYFNNISFNTVLSEDIPE